MSALERLPKINFIAIAAGVIGLLSVIFPWWSISSKVLDLSYSLNLYGASGTAFPGSDTTEQFFRNLDAVGSIVGLISLLLVLVGSLISLSSSVYLGKKSLVAGGILIILGVALYVVFLNLLLRTADTGWPEPLSKLGLSGSEKDVMSWGLSIGFYLAIVAGILSFVAMVVHDKLRPKVVAATAPTS